MTTQTLPTPPAGVTVSLDETGRDPLLTITMPKGATLPKAFVQACHHLAGEAGAGIRFVTPQRAV